MVSLKNKYHLVLILILTCTILSCRQNDEFIKRALISDFELSKPTFDTVIKYVIKEYYNNENVKNFNQLQFVLSNKPYNKRGVFSDTSITYKLKETVVLDISFEKASFCLDKFTYDIVRFKLNTTGSNYIYYYVYEFCPLSKSTVSSLNFESIPLTGNWSLQIEKS